MGGSGRLPVLTTRLILDGSCLHVLSSFQRAELPPPRGPTGRLRPVPRFRGNLPTLFQLARLVKYFLPPGTRPGDHRTGDVRIRACATSSAGRGATNPPRLPDAGASSAPGDLQDTRPPFATAPPAPLSIDPPRTLVNGDRRSAARAHVSDPFPARTCDPMIAHRGCQPPSRVRCRSSLETSPLLTRQECPQLKSVRELWKTRRRVPTRWPRHRRLHPAVPRSPRRGAGTLARPRRPRARSHAPTRPSSRWPSMMCVVTRTMMGRPGAGRPACAPPTA
jgi:hypothetical protein